MQSYYLPYRSQWLTILIDLRNNRGFGTWKIHPTFDYIAFACTDFQRRLDLITIFNQIELSRRMRQYRNISVLLGGDFGQIICIIVWIRSNIAFILLIFRYFQKLFGFQLAMAKTIICSFVGIVFSALHLLLWISTAKRHLGRLLWTVDIGRGRGLVFNPVDGPALDFGLIRIIVGCLSLISYLVINEPKSEIVTISFKPLAHWEKLHYYLITINRSIYLPESFNLDI